MIDFDERIGAIRQGTTFQRPEIEAIGMVYEEILRPVTLEPLPWSMIDALRAVGAVHRCSAPGAKQDLPETHGVSKDSQIAA